MTSLRHFSLVSVLAIIYVIIVLVAELPSYFIENNPWKNP